MLGLGRAAVPRRASLQTSDQIVEAANPAIQQL
jgi:hypothetical protein